LLNQSDLQLTRSSGTGWAYGIMKRFIRWLELLLLVVLAAGCNTERPAAVIVTPWDDLPKLERIARDYAKAHNVAFDFSNTRAEAGAKEATDIAYVYFYHDKSQPFFRCKIDHEGQVLEAGLVEPASTTRRAHPYAVVASDASPGEKGARVVDGTSASNPAPSPPQSQPGTAGATQVRPPEAESVRPSPLAASANTGAWRGDAHLDTLRVGGVTYTNVTVTTVLTEEVFFRHDGGTGHAKLKELDPEMQQQLAHSTFSLERRFAQYNCAITIPSGYQGARLDLEGGPAFEAAFQKNDRSRTVGLIMLNEDYKGDVDDGFAARAERELIYSSFEVEASLPGRYLLVGGLKGYEHVILLHDTSPRGKKNHFAEVIRYVAAEGRVYVLIGMMPNESIETPGNDPEIMATLDSFRFLQAPAPDAAPAALQPSKAADSKFRSHLHLPKVGIILACVGMLLAFCAFYWFCCHCLKRICEKCGETAGVLIYIPMLHLFPLLRAAGMSRALIVLFLIPGVGFIAAIVMWVKICQACGKSGWLAALVIIPGVNLFAVPYLAYSK